MISRQPAPALARIEADAERLGGPLIQAGRDFDAWAEADRMAFQDAGSLIELPPPALFGAHQIDNAGVAVAAARALAHLGIDEAAIARGVASAAWPARMQRLTVGPLAEMAAAREADLWLDGAHNPHAAAALSESVRRLSVRDGRPATLIVGLLTRKDAHGVFAALKGDRLLTTGFAAELAADPVVLARAAAEVGQPAEAHADVQSALRAALSADGPPPHVVICGSLYLAGEVLALSPLTWPT